MQFRSWSAFADELDSAARRWHPWFAWRPIWMRYNYDRLDKPESRDRWVWWETIDRKYSEVKWKRPNMFDRSLMMPEEADCWVYKLPDDNGYRDYQYSGATCP